ncbi:MAG TPA: tetratricopeptide repeat protein [Opitutus sp.]|nr:tetratricopeptide repeat protein [Opitutus sp.]
MMTWRRWQSWLAALAGIALVAGGVAAQGGDAGALPADVKHDGLPPQFDRALHAARADVDAHPGATDALRRLAHLYQANRLFREARACYRVIAALPGGLQAQDHYLLAAIARSEGDLAGVQAELRAVIAADPDYLPARLGLAEALFKSGQEDAAEKEYLAIVAKDASQPQAALGLARIDLQRDHDDAAVARLEDLMAAHPEFTSGAALFAQVLERRGEHDRAVAMTQLSQQKPETPPPDPWLDGLLADCYDVQRLSITFEEYFKLGKMAEAVPVLDRLSELDPDGPITKMFAGFSHAKALQHVTAIREYYDALQKGGDPEKVCPLLTESLLALGKVAEAAGLLADYHAKLPASMPIAKAYAQVALRQGDNALARKLLEQVLEKQPYLREENMSLAQILWDAGDRDDAVQCLQRVATAYANDVGSRALLGEYHLGKSDPLAAIPPLEQASGFVTAKTPAAASLKAMLATAYLQAANAAAEKGAWADAADHYEKLSRLVPDKPEGFAGWANASVQLRQFGRAARALEGMAAIETGNPTIYLSLGDVQYQDGKAGPARRNWTKAKSLVAPGDTDLMNALDRRLNGPVTPDLFQ